MHKQRTTEKDVLNRKFGCLEWWTHHTILLLLVYGDYSANEILQPCCPSLILMLLQVQWFTLTTGLLTDIRVLANISSHDTVNHFVNFEDPVTETHTHKQ